MDNHFANSPTVGSDSIARSMAEDLCSRVQNLEQRVTALEQSRHDEHQHHGEQPRCDERQDYYEEPRPKKIKWKKIRRFFDSIVKPVLNFIPNIINAVANLNKAAAPKKSKKGKKGKKGNKDKKDK